MNIDRSIFTVPFVVEVLGLEINLAHQTFAFLVHAALHEDFFLGAIKSEEAHAHPRGVNWGTVVAVAKLVCEAASIACPVVNGMPS